MLLVVCQSSFNKAVSANHYEICVSAAIGDSADAARIIQRSTSVHQGRRLSVDNPASLPGLGFLPLENRPGQGPKQDMPGGRRCPAPGAAGPPGEQNPPGRPSVLLSLRLRPLTIDLGHLPVVPQALAAEGKRELWPPKGLQVVVSGLDDEAAGGGEGVAEEQARVLLY